MDGQAFLWYMYIEDEEISTARSAVMVISAIPEMVDMVATSSHKDIVKKTSKYLRSKIFFLPLKKSAG
jgi:hypothetical protein